jgi:hypothetical protein
MHRSAPLLPVLLALGVSLGSATANATDVFWANVSSVGKLTRGEGASSAERLSKGTYLVTFNANVSKCNYGISLTSYGIAFTRPSAGDNTSVFIGIITADSEDFLDTNFYLQVICK